MTASAPSPDGSQSGINTFEINLLKEHGELMTGTSLRLLWHMKHERAFRRAAVAGRLPVSVFRLPGRKGWFARTRDVAAWLASLDTPAIGNEAAAANRPTPLTDPAASRPAMGRDGNERTGD